MEQTSRLRRTVFLLSCLFSETIWFLNVFVQLVSLADPCCHLWIFQKIPFHCDLVPSHSPTQMRELCVLAQTSNRQRRDAFLSVEYSGGSSAGWVALTVCHSKKRYAELQNSKTLGDRLPTCHLTAASSALRWHLLEALLDMYTLYSTLSSTRQSSWKAIYRLTSTL